MGSGVFHLNVVD